MKRIKAKVNFLAGLVVFMALIVCSPIASWASFSADYIDFNMGGANPSTATMYYLGGATPFYGRDIQVDTVAGFKIGNILEGGPLAITNGRLNFTTGNLTGYSSNVWTFSGGTIDITGTVAIPGSTTNLLTGTFGTVQVQRIDIGSQYVMYNVTTANFIDTKDHELAEYFFGYDPGRNGFRGGLNLSFITAPNATSGGFTSLSVLSGDVINTPVPLPGAVWLLGTGLIGLVGVRRRLRG